MIAVVDDPLVVSGPMACERCQPLNAVRSLRKPTDYRTFIRELIERIDRGELRMVDGVPLAPLLVEGSVWPDDIISHTFECVSCGQRFEMAVDTYHGSGGAWRPAH